MQFLKKIFLKYTQTRQLKKALKIINKTSDVIKNMNPRNPPAKNIFLKAIETLENIEKDQPLPEDTIKSLGKFKITCVQTFASILHAEGTIPFQKGDYKRTITILNELLCLIVNYCEIFEIEKLKLTFFLEDIKKDFKDNPEEIINFKELNPMRIKYQEKARKLFQHDMGSLFAEMIVDAIIIPIVCEIADKNKISGKSLC